MAQGKLIGPADAEGKVKENESLIEGVKTINDPGFSLTDFKSLTQDTVKFSHPFEGYGHPMGKIKVIAKNYEKKVIGEIMIHTAFVVAFVGPVHQDPSGSGYVITQDYKMDETLLFGPYEGKTVEQVIKLDKEYATNLIRTGKQKHAPLTTSHNRALRDWQEMRNYDVVFDRVAILKDGEMPNVAIVPNHNLRAQLVYKLDERTGAVKVDTRYAVIDHQQRSRLLATFRMIAAPQVKNIRLQQLVTGEMQLPEGTDLASALGEKE